MPRSPSIENGFFLLLLALVTITFLWIVQDFLQPVFWAALLALLFHGVHRRLLARIGDRPSLSALLVLMLIVLIVIVPVFLLGIAMTNESAALYERVTSGQVDLQAPLRWASQASPAANEMMDRVGLQPDKITEWMSSAAVTVSKYIGSKALAIGQNTLAFFVSFVLMLYLVFFFVRDGRRILDGVVHVLPLGDERERRFMTRFAEVSRAMLKGTLVVGVVQGTIGGITLASLGFQGAVFWGVIMTVLSLLPALGAALVWMPAAIWLFATGEIIRGVILVVVGVFVIGLVDNVLRPILVGRDTQLPDYLVLLATLGGLTAFGLSGFVIGPVVAALFLAAWEMFATDFRDHEEPGA
jgi:predicted PurR-regulated permease PerM